MLSMLFYKVTSHNINSVHILAFIDSIFSVLWMKPIWFEMLSILLLFKEQKKEKMGLELIDDTAIEHFFETH